MNKCLVFDRRADLAELKPKTLFCAGGSRSGKSDFALNYGQTFAGQKAYVATMQKNFAGGEACGESEKRIKKHREQRDGTWTTIEEPFDLIQALELAKNQKFSMVLIDCISLWLSNLVLSEKTEEEILNSVETLCAYIKNYPLPLVLVSSEVGQGLVSEYAAGRLFQDVQGKANQLLAEVCQAAVIVNCGIPLLLKG